MNLRRVSTEELVKELTARTVYGVEVQELPIDTTKNHLLMVRDSRGRFVKKSNV